MDGTLGAMTQVCILDFLTCSVESIKNFLSQDDIAIYNEYGEHFTVDQLFKDELNNSLYKDSTHDDGMNGGYSEYYFKSEDGLRFSKFEDFS